MAPKGRRGPVPAAPLVQKLRKTPQSRRRGGGDAVAVAAPGSGRTVNPALLLPTDPPAHLVDEAAECWTRITTMQRTLAENGTQPFVTITETELLEVACVNYRHWRLAVSMFNERAEKILAEAPNGRHQILLSGRETRDGGQEINVGAHQKLVERTEKKVRESFRSLGLPHQTPVMLAEIEARADKKGGKVALRLLAGGGAR